MTVDKLISDWSDQEKEDLKDLIKECREREGAIDDARKRSLRGIKEIEMAYRGDIADIVWAVTANWKSIGRC